MVEFADGAIKAQLSCPDMRLPIQYALCYPERLTNSKLPKLDWSRFSSLTFQQPDLDTFRCLMLATEAGRKGGTYPAVLCGADDIAVEFFLSRRIKFVDIANLVEQTLEQHQVVTHPTLEEIVAADVWARDKVIELVEG
jgi:1-deoxy-D-xylulose-5-phosphate reductoisomerase